MANRGVKDMIKDIFRSTLPLEKGLDASWLRNQVITNNIANVETPNFKASSVEFESVFRAALKNEGIALKSSRGFEKASRRLEDVSPRVTKNRNTSMRMDGNNVDIDAENALLAKNTIYYNTLVQKLNTEYRKLRMAINEGR